MRILIVLLAAAALDAAEILVVAHKWADSMGFYDAATGRELSTIPAGIKPHEFAVTPDQRIAYVTNYGVDRWTDTAPGANTISIVDLAKRAKVGEIGLGLFRRPHGIERGGSGRLYVTADFPPAVLLIDPETRKVVRHFELESNSLPHMVMVRHDEKKAFTANSGTGTVSAIDLAGRRPAKHIAIGGVPMGLAFSRDGRTLWAANRTGNAVVVIDASTERVTGRLEIPGHPARVLLTPDEKHLLVSLIDAGDVAVVDTSSLKVVRRFRAGANVEGMTTDAEGRFGYASAQGENKVVKFSLEDWQPVLEIKTGARPDPLAVISAP